MLYSSSVEDVDVGIGAHEGSSSPCILGGDLSGAGLVLQIVC